MTTEVENGRLSLHELATLFPPMTDEEIADLKTDISQNGVHQPIAVWQDSIIDGRHRYHVCQELGIEPPLRHLPDDADPVAFVVSANMNRRHLTASQRAMIGEELRNLEGAHTQDINSGEAAKTSTEVSGAFTQSEVRDKLGVSLGSLSRAARVRERGIEPITQAVKSGLVTVRDADRVVDRDQDTQLEALEAVVGGEARTLLSAVNTIDRRTLAEDPPDLPTGTYRTLVLDPPWPMKKSDRSVRPDQQGFDYPTMSLDEIADLPVGELVAEDAWVFLWTTQRFLPPVFNYVDARIAVEPEYQTRGLLENWGLDYRFTMVWRKRGGMQIFGLPQFDCEFVVVASKGEPLFTDRKDFSTVFEAPRAGHSVKPDEFYDLLRRVTASPRLDMFNRRDIEGFEGWGNERD